MQPLSSEGKGPAWAQGQTAPTDTRLHEPCKQTLPHSTTGGHRSDSSSQPYLTACAAGQSWSVSGPPARQAAAWGCVSWSWWMTWSRCAAAAAGLPGRPRQHRPLQQDSTDREGSHFRDTLWTGGGAPPGAACATWSRQHQHNCSDNLAARSKETADQVVSTTWCCSRQQPYW